MTRRGISLALFTLIGLFTIVSPIVADWNATHLFNPNWPPHARFHDAHTMSFGILLGALTIVFAWRSAGIRRDNLIVAALFGALYWVAQLMAVAYPNTRLMDPEFDVPSSYIFGMPINMFANINVLLLLIPALLLGLRAERASARAG